MPIAGSYRSIDFSLSNMSNSHIQKVGVFTQYNARSLNEHLNSSKWWDFGRKQGGLYVFTPTITADNGYWYRGTADAIYQNLDFLKRCHEPYVIIAPSYMVYAQNYAELLQTHIDSEADITLLYQSVDNAREEFINCDILNLNKQKGVESIEKNRGSAQKRNIFMDTYIMKKELFIELIKKARKISSMYTLPQIVNSLAGELDIRGVAHRGFFASITDFNSYYNAISL